MENVGSTIETLVKLLCLPPHETKVKHCARLLSLLSMNCESCGCGNFYGHLYILPSPKKQYVHWWGWFEPLIFLAGSLIDWLTTNFQSDENWFASVLSLSLSRRIFQTPLAFSRINPGYTCMKCPNKSNWTNTRPSIPMRNEVFCILLPHALTART